MSSRFEERGSPGSRSAEGASHAGWRRVLVVVPCFNERTRLDLATFNAFAQESEEVGFLFVDDGSLDGTADLIEDQATVVPDRLRLLRLGDNFGKAEAVRAGLRHVLGFSPEIVGFWDADLATPLEELVPMLRVLESEPDLQAVLGSRVRLLGRAIHRKAYRHYLGRVFSTAASLTLEMPVYDTQCGAKLFRVTPALESLLEKPFLSRWVFDVELLARFRETLGGEGLGWIEEYPLRCWRDVGGSKLGLTSVLGAALDLARIWARHRADR